MLNTAIRFLSYLVFKSFIKKILVSILLFSFVYFSIDELSALKIASGQKDHEVAQEIKIGRGLLVSSSARTLKYSIANTGIQNVNLALSITSYLSSPRVSIGNIRKLYSNTSDPRSVDLTYTYPYQNSVKFNTFQLPAGIAVDIYVFDDPKISNFLSELKINLQPELNAPSVFMHKINRTPKSIMIIRFAYIFSLCFGVSIFLHVIWGTFVKAYAIHHE